MKPKEYAQYIRQRVASLFSRESIFGEFDILQSKSQGSDSTAVEDASTETQWRHIASLDDIVAHNAETETEGYAINGLAIDTDIALTPDISIVLKGISYVEGNGHTISIEGERSAIFGDVDHSIDIANLHIASQGECRIVGNEACGALINNTYANTILRNIVVEGCTIVAEQTAGGFIGHIGRREEQDRSRSIAVLFEGCRIATTTIVAQGLVGEFVGTLTGYDAAETVVFESSSSSEITLRGIASLYTDANKSSWLNDIDLTSYDAWVGGQKYHRGNILFDGNRLTLRWDGKRAIEPLLAEAQYDGTNIIGGEERYVVYSPFDLAGIRRATDSPKAIYLKSDIDMFGYGEDGIYRIPEEFDSATESADDNNFDPFFEVETLDGRGNDGKNHAIFNLSIYQPEQMHSAFIRHASGYTIHHHIDFVNCRTATTHKIVERDAKAYGAILVGRIDSVLYTMDDVHAYDCKVYALQKGGPLAARVAAKQSYLKNCTTHRCYVENYQCWIPERFDSGYKSLGLFKARAYVDYFPHGEMGGMFGFVQNSSDISNCHVYGATVNAYGQDDVMATMLAPDGWRELIDMYGYYKVPGRHASTFIGDIRATGIINITNCTADAESRCTRQYNCHSSRYPHIGQCYIVKFEDKEGSVTIDGERVLIADCNKWTDLENNTMLKK